MKLKGKVAIITGAGRGIGAATAIQLAKEGAKVVLASRTEAQLADTAAHIIDQVPHASVLTIPTDVSVESSVKTLFQEARDHFGGVHYLVNNAATIEVHPFEDFPTEDFEKIMDVNVGGVFYCCREAFRVFDSEEGGSIVNVSSIGGISGTEKFFGFSAYSASKFAVVGLTECLALEGQNKKIRVNCIAPGAVETEMLHKAAPGLKASLLPSDLASVILEILVSPKTGQIIPLTQLEKNQRI